MNIQQNGVIDARATMYPSYATIVKEPYQSQEHSHSTCFGYAFKQTTLQLVSYDTIDYDCAISPGHFFSLPINQGIRIFSDHAFCVFRYGFRGQEVSGKVEERGRLSYIDGCSSSLLVYPPRKGDPSLHFLHLPAGVEQSFHTHPTIRIGCVLSGTGMASVTVPVLSPLGNHKIQTGYGLEEGSMFYLEENEEHRFISNSSLRIIAFHPDSDWGPTDENHPMLNRTYLK